MEVKSLKELFVALKLRFYNFLSTTAFNLSTLEGLVLGGLVYYFPSHAKEITEFFAMYLGFKKDR
jgi:hypothetical protein